MKLNIKSIISSDFIKRLKALLWSCFGQFLALGLDLVVQSLTEWNPDHIITVSLGLIITQITKQLNKKPSIQ